MTELVLLQCSRTSSYSASTATGQSRTSKNTTKYCYSVLLAAMIVLVLLQCSRPSSDRASPVTRHVTSHKCASTVTGQSRASNTTTKYCYSVVLAAMIALVLLQCSRPRAVTEPVLLQGMGLAINVLLLSLGKVGLAILLPLLQCGAGSNDSASTSTVTV